MLALLTFGLVSWEGKFVLSEDVMFLAADSHEYRAVAGFLLGGEFSDSLEIRPLLYPLLIALPYKLFGVWGIWLLQLLAWLLSVHLLFTATRLLTKSKWLPWLVAVVFLLNFSLIAMIYHALTELVTVLGLATVVYLLARYSGKLQEEKFVNRMLLLFVALTLVKPVFIYPMVAVLLYALLTQWRRYIKSRASALRLLWIVLPLVLQCTLVYVNFGRFTVSTIGEITVKKYLLAQEISRSENIDFEEAQERAMAMRGEERNKYMSSHFPQLMDCYEENLRDNVAGIPVYLDFTSATKKKGLTDFMQDWNTWMKDVHVLFAAIWMVLLLYLTWCRDWNAVLQIGGLGLLLAYYILTTGISFWQGDRLVLPSIGIWAPLYVLIVFRICSELVSAWKPVFIRR